MGMTRVRDVETGTGGRKGIGNKWKMMKSDQSPLSGWLPVPRVHRAKSRI